MVVFFSFYTNCNVEFISVGLRQILKRLPWWDKSKLHSPIGRGSRINAETLGYRLSGCLGGVKAFT